MLTGYTMAVAIPNKSAETIVKAYIDHVYSVFGGSSCMLTDNRSEFRNDVFDEVCDKLGIKRVYSPVYTPQSNGKLEGFHHFFKACISKHIRENQLEWDEIVPLATAAYNFFPCQSSRESPFVLMFGRDTITPFLSLLEPSPRYWGERGGHLHLDALQHLYAVMAENLKRAREKETTETEVTLQNDLKIGDLVLVRNMNSGVFELKYSPYYRIIAIHGNNHIAVKAPDGKVQVRCRGHIKKIDPVDKVISLLPSMEDYQKFGRKTKLFIHPDNISDTNISLPSSKQAKTISEEDEDSKNYPILHEKSKTNLNTASDMEMLNCIDCSIEETINEVNISLISAPCHVTEETKSAEHVDVQSTDELVWDKLKSLLSSKSVVKRNENSSFSFFPVKNKYLNQQFCFKYWPHLG